MIGTISPVLRSDLPTYLTVQTTADIDRYLDQIRASAARFQAWVKSHDGEPLEMLRLMKFHKVGFHPIEDRPLNVIEQVNQTWTFAVALVATRTLLELHPDVGGFMVAPGAHMSIPLDIMSCRAGLVGAETFAAVDPRNNAKLAGDLRKLGALAETPHRYVFFSSPKYPLTQHRAELDREGVQVWSVKV